MLNLKFSDRDESNWAGRGIAHMVMSLVKYENTGPRLVVNVKLTHYFH